MINRKTGLLLAFVLALLAGCNDSGKKSEEFRVPAEFESQSAVWLSSPTVDYKHDWSMLETQAHMIKELITSVHVHYAVNEDGDIDRLRDALAALDVSADAIDERVHFHAVEHGDLWVRDTGGTFMKDGNGNYLWQAGDVQKGIPGSFNGRSYSINQAMDSLAAAKKVMLFGDFSKYFVRKVGGIVMFVARERFAPDIGLLGLIRLDGELGDTAAVKHLITAAT